MLVRGAFRVHDLSMNGPGGRLFVTLVVLVAAGGCGSVVPTPTEQGSVLRWAMNRGQSEPFHVFNGWLTAGWNVFEPLVKLDDGMRPIPNIAERWDVSDDGLTYTFHLRSDGRWTNGDPLTAADYEYGWKYNIRDGGDYYFAGIVGAPEFAACDSETEDCDALSAAVAIAAVDERTLEVTLRAPEPWFVTRIAGAACVCFAPLHRATVERYGDDWVRAENIVSSGPFRIETWDQTSLTLVKDPSWRGAADVELDRVEVTFYADNAVAGKAFEDGEADVGHPDLDRYTSDPGPALHSAYIGLNTELIPDPNQRRAMALILDRQAIDDRGYSGVRRPATTLTADNIPGWERMNHAFLVTEPNEATARQLMNMVERPQLSVTIWFNEDPGKRVAVLEAAAAWEKLGIQTTVRGLKWDTGYLPMLQSGNPFDNAYIGSWGYDYPEAVNFLENWRCGGQDGTLSAYCDPAYDAVLDLAANEIDEGRRTDLYAQAEAMLTGEAGAMPAIPTTWGEIPVAFRGPAAGAVFINAMGQLDLTRVDLGS